MKKFLNSLLIFTMLISPSAFSQRRELNHEAAPVSERRVALVICSGAYAVGPLKNPVTNARAAAQALRELGFEVAYGEDLTQNDMKRAVREFGAKLRRVGGVGLFYYAGRGVQARGENYLIPVDATPQSAEEIEYEAVPAGLALAQMEAAGNDVNILILDACRNNPFKRSFRSGVDGLALMPAPTGTLIAYATEPNSVANDGGGSGNSIYTKELIRHIRTPGVSIVQMFIRVAASVQAKTGRRQKPRQDVGLTRDFYLVPPANPAETAAWPRLVPEPTPAAPSATKAGNAAAPGNVLMLPKAAEGGGAAAPGEARGHVEAARASEAKGGYAGAETEYRKAVSLTPEKALYHHALGIFLQAQRERDRSNQLRQDDYFGALRAADEEANRKEEWRQQAQADCFRGQLDFNQRQQAQAEMDRRAGRPTPLPPRPAPDPCSAYAYKWEPPAPIARSPVLPAAEPAARPTPSESSAPEFSPSLTLKKLTSENSLLDAFKKTRTRSGVLTELAEAVRLEPENAAYHFDNGSALATNWLHHGTDSFLVRAPLSTDDAKKAEEEFRAAVWLDPLNAKYHAELGSVLGRQNRWAAAVVAYGEAMRLDPKNEAYKSAHKDARRKAK